MKDKKYTFISEKNISMILIFAIIILCACQEKINIKLDETFTRLVVDGSFSTDTAIQKIKLTTTSDYFHNQPAPRVSGAKVIISDGDTSIMLIENDNASGVYETDNNFYCDKNKTYTLTITNVDIDKDGNYEEYYAQSSVVRPNSEIDSINLTYNERWNMLVIHSYAWDPPTKDFYLMKVYKNGVLVSDSVSEYFVTDDVLFNGNYTNGIASQFLDQNKADEIIRLGDIITLEIDGINEDYYNYLLELQQELQGSNPIFSGPPANVKSNINNGALGFFTTYSLTRASVVVKELPDK